MLPCYLLVTGCVNSVTIMTNEDSLSLSLRVRLPPAARDTDSVRTHWSMLGHCTEVAVKKCLILQDV